MKDSVVPLIILLAIQTYSLKFSHLEPQFQLSGSQKNAADAFRRLTDFLQKQNASSHGFNEKGMSDAQKSNLLQFYATDPYFSQTLIDEASKNSYDSWIKQLSPQAQILYLQTITKLSKKQIQDPNKLALSSRQLTQNQKLGKQFKKIQQNNKQFVNKQSSSWLLKFI